MRVLSLVTSAGMEDSRTSWRIGARFQDSTMNSSRLNEQDLTNSKLDALDRKLIAELQGDARLAYAALGAKLGVTGMTAANRLQRLRQSDLLRFRVTPNFEAYGLTTE